LGFPDFKFYLQDPYFGPFVGRVANRIANGQFELEGMQFGLDKNENGLQTLHGGKNGISAKNWKIVRHDETSVTLKTLDTEAETGFPGDCEIFATYHLAQDQTLAMEIAANSTKTTICSIAHHSYFNLNGYGTILRHQLQVFADHYLPVDENQIPIGDIKSVKGLEFDFRQLKNVETNGDKDFDHNFCLNSYEGKPRPVGRLVGDQSKVEMDISSDQPGLQVYTGKHLNTSIAGTNGENLKPYSGIALEPQGWPDAPNRPEFPSILLAAGQTYRQKTEFKFSKTGN
jgi:aldose 1-epimerase